MSTAGNFSLRCWWWCSMIVFSNKVKIRWLPLISPTYVYFSFEVTLVITKLESSLVIIYWLQDGFWVLNCFKVKKRPIHKFQSKNEFQNRFSIEQGQHNTGWMCFVHFLFIFCSRSCFVYVIFAYSETIFINFKIIFSQTWTKREHFSRWFVLTDDVCSRNVHKMNCFGDFWDFFLHSNIYQIFLNKIHILQRRRRLTHCIRLNQTSFVCYKSLTFCGECSYYPSTLKTSNALRASDV